MLVDEIPSERVAVHAARVSGLGSASGFKIIIEDSRRPRIYELQKQMDRVIAAGNAGRFKLTDESFAALLPIPRRGHRQRRREGQRSPQASTRRRDDKILVAQAVETKRNVPDFASKSSAAPDRGTGSSSTDKSFAALRGGPRNPLPSRGHRQATSLRNTTSSPRSCSTSAINESLIEAGLTEKSEQGAPGDEQI